MTSFTTTRTEKFKDYRESIKKENEEHAQYTLDDIFDDSLAKLDELIEEIDEMSKKYAKK